MSEKRRIALLVLAYGLLFILVFSLQTVLDGRVALAGRSLNLMPYLAAFTALLTGPNGGAAAGAAIGLMLDASSARVEGFYTVLYLALSIAVGYLCRRYYRVKLQTGLLMGAALSVVLDGLRLVLFFVLFDRAGFDVFVRYVLPATLWSGLVAVPFYFLMRFLRRRIMGEYEL